MQHAQGDKGEKRRRYGTVPIPGFVRHAWERAHNLSQTKNLEAYDRVYGGDDSKNNNLYLYRLNQMVYIAKVIPRSVTLTLLNKSIFFNF